MIATSTPITEIMSAFPALSAAGIHFRCLDRNWNDRATFERSRSEMLSDGFTRQVSLCEAFIARHGIKRGASSYRLKHLIEADHTNTYISNGATIVAAIKSGYALVLHESPNPTFRKAASSKGGDHGN